MKKPVHRTRRSPEAAQALLLAAAERLFARAMPDEVGLKEIAAEAGVSHGLVTHYFGTYEKLVETCLQRLLARSRQTAMERFMRSTLDGSEWPFIDSLLESVRDPATVRLLSWSLLTGRVDRSDYLPLQKQNMGMAVELITARFGASGPPRARVEDTVLVVLASAIGLGLIGARVHEALGRGPARDFDPKALREVLGPMVHGYLRSAATPPKAPARRRKRTG